jgi:hypothetical protein
MKYPLTITEIPHRGKAKTWMLDDEDHLQDILNGSQACRAGCHATDLDSYLDWLRSDLRQLIVEEAR